MPTRYRMLLHGKREDPYNATYGKQHTPATLVGNDRIVSRIERVDGEFIHGHVAAYFLANQHTIIPTLSAATTGRFENLIAALDAALPPP